MTSPADRPRVVFDCNVLIQAIANDAGPSGTALRHLQRNLIEVFVSRPVLKELRSVLNYQRSAKSSPAFRMIGLKFLSSSYSFERRCSGKFHTSLTTRAPNRTSPMLTWRRLQGPITSSVGIGIYFH